MIYWHNNEVDGIACYAREPSLLTFGVHERLEEHMLDATRNREFMEIAIEEMRKSRSEHKCKADPMVGAVVVGRDGKELGRAHRGALREGDHAEYTLLERKLGDLSLEGGSLYVTLEPCTERSAKKSPCADRIIRARLANVFVGIPDPNPNILGRGIQKLINNGVEVDFFDLDLVNVIRKENDEFIKYHEEAEAEGDSAPFEGPSDKEKEA